MRSPKAASLNHQLIIGTAMIVGFSLLLSVSIVASYFAAYRRADANLSALRVYRQVLIAANILSAERGPMNAVLGEEPSADSPLRRKLAEFRARSDAALDSLAPRDPIANEELARVVPPDAVANVRIRLAAARAAADALANLPRSERPFDRIRGVINGMFDVIDTMQPVVTGAINTVVAGDDSLAGMVLLAQMFSDMREYAGRVGSYVIPAVASHETLDHATIVNFREANGRLREIWHLAEWRAGFYSADPQLAAARNDINARYFGFGLPMINAVLEQGRYTGDFGVTTAELTERYVATMEPIERMRMAFLDLTIERPVEMRATALQWLIYVSCVTGLIVLANGLIIFYARRLVFRPLMAAADQIVALSEGREIDTTAKPAHGRELCSLFEAVGELQVRLRERVRHTERLRVDAETDELTGLANRRRVDRIGSSETAVEGLPDVVGVIMIDLDHFKQINDRYGHPSGDEVLRRVADVIRAHAEPGDVCGRYGGEEFTIALASGPGQHVAARAEAIRRAIEAMRIAIEDGRQFGITASFGVCGGHRGAETLPRIIAAADRALYRAKSLGRNRVCVSEQAVAVSAVA